MFFSPIFIWFCPIYSILPTHHLSLLTLLSTYNTTQIDLTNMAFIEKTSFLVTLILCQLLTLFPLLTILSNTNTAYINLSAYLLLVNQPNGQEPLLTSLSISNTSHKSKKFNCVEVNNFKL